MQDWERDKTLKVELGQRISAEVFETLRDSVPPAFLSSTLFQNGEPSFHMGGKPMHQSFVSAGDGEWEYIGIRPLQPRKLYNN